MTPRNICIFLNSALQCGPAFCSYARCNADYAQLLIYFSQGKTPYVNNNCRLGVGELGEHLVEPMEAEMILRRCLELRAFDDQGLALIRDELVKRAAADLTELSAAVGVVPSYEWQASVESALEIVIQNWGCLSPAHAEAMRSVGFSVAGGSACMQLE